MSMRTYGVETKGMIIELTDFQRLMNSNIKGIKEKGLLTDIETDNEDLELSDLLEFDEIIDFVDNINYATFIGEFNGYLDTDKAKERVYFGNRFGSGVDIILIELMRNNLFESYKNRDEIIEELKDDLSRVGIIVDNKYIEEHFGYINGSYYA